jgi:hypothetical protein
LFRTISPTALFATSAGSALIYLNDRNERREGHLQPVVRRHGNPLPGGRKDLAPSSVQQEVITMSQLLEDLKNDHRVILDILDQVKTAGIISKAGQEKLLSAKAVLIAHMKKEDAGFYPALQKAAETNDALKRTVAYFVEDMENVSEKAMRVFDKLAREAPDEDIAGELKLLYVTLKDRIRTEEDILFKKYEQLNP